MNLMVPVGAAHLPSMIERAASALMNAKSSAEVLEAKDIASVAYDAAKSAARLAKAKGAHDSVIAAVHRAQADALEIEAQAKRRLADEYDAAQERGEVASGRPKSLPDEKTFQPTAADIGLSHKVVHDARQVRDAEAADPGIVRRTLDAKLDAGQEPTRAALREAVVEAAVRGIRGQSVLPRTSNRNPIHEPDPAYDALLAFIGPCRSLIERTKGVDPAFAWSGVIDEGMRERHRGLLREAASILNQMIEVAHA